MLKFDIVNGMDCCCTFWKKNTASDISIFFPISQAMKSQLDTERKTFIIL